MRRLKKPKELVEDVFMNCLSNMRESDLKKRLISCNTLILAAAKEFEEKVVKQKLHTILRITVTNKTKLDKLVNGNVTVDEMKDVYTNKFVPVGSPGRALYDKLFSAPSFGICPLCSHREVETLDHHLPKAHYPTLSVTPSNLIPSCYKCNISKKTNCPNSSEQETLHPYFDDIEDDEWLVAEVINSSPPIVKFSVQKPAKWSNLLFTRVKFHFNSLELNSLYSTQAAKELVRINHMLNKRLNEGGQVSVSKFLLEEAESSSMASLNSWQSAMYRAIGNDKWYCSLGFKLQIK